jgi:dTDP-4-dehydrorhamnose reductase
MAIDYTATLTLANSERQGKIIIVNGIFCGSDATFSPRQLRIIATALNDAADRAEAGEIGHIEIEYKASSYECASTILDD